jgi:demethylmenaquinone methyltransferase/2-methoxy-6-polyprenyl-1,4-benzoquinol methylase
MEPIRGGKLAKIDNDYMQRLDALRPGKTSVEWCLRYVQSFPEVFTVLSGMSDFEQVKQMFDDIAPTYDRLNHILSLSIDKIWRNRVVRAVRRLGAKEILDIATGTGDLAIAMAKHSSHIKVKGIDIYDEMIRTARKKVDKLRLNDKIVFYKENVESLSFEDGTFDYCTMAFGIRNFQNPGKALAEVYRVLKPGGRVYILELYKKPSSKIIRFFYKLYSKVWIPLLGSLLARNKEAYTYLPESVSEFMNRKEFKKLMKKVGFMAIRHKKLTNGIAIFYEGVKM